MALRSMDYSPLHRWMGTQAEGAAADANLANNQFTQAIQTQARPIYKMIDADGNLDAEAIKKWKPMDSMEMWNTLTSNLEGTGRSADPVMFQEKLDQGEQLFKSNLFNELNLMKQSGMDNAEIVDALGDNKDLLDYVLRNQELGVTMEDDWDINWKDIGKGAAKFGVGTGAFYGASRAISNRVPVAASRELFKTLGDSGFERKGKFGVRKISDNALARKHNLDRLDERPQTKGGKPDKRFKPRPGGLTPDAKKELNRIKSAREKLIRDNPTLKKAVGGSKTAGGRILSKPSSITKRGISAAIRAGMKTKGPAWARGAAALGGGLIAATGSDKLFDKLFGK